jgi:hypothetical protein
MQTEDMPPGTQPGVIRFSVENIPALEIPLDSAPRAN